MPGGFSDYDGLNVSYRQRLTRGFQFQGSYTLSKVEGNILPGSDEFRLGSPGSLHTLLTRFQNRATR